MTDRAPTHRDRPEEKPHRLRPLTTHKEQDQEQAPEPGASLVAIDNPDDADIYPPTETPKESSGRRRVTPRREG